MPVLVIGRLGRMALTMWFVATLVFLAARLTGDPIDVLMPEGLHAASRAAMIDPACFVAPADT